MNRLALLIINFELLFNEIEDQVGQGFSGFHTIIRVFSRGAFGKMQADRLESWCNFFDEFSRQALFYLPGSVSGAQHLLNDR